MTVQKHELDTKSLAITGGIIGFISGILAAIIHSGIGVQSYMGMDRMMWGSPMFAGWGIVWFTIIGLFYGWLLAVVYNYVVKNF